MATKFLIKEKPMTCTTVLCYLAFVSLFPIISAHSLRHSRFA